MGGSCVHVYVCMGGFGQGHNMVTDIESQRSQAGATKTVSELALNGNT